MKPSLIQGGVFEDDRGQLRFVNDFDLAGLRRAYVIRHRSTSVVRAWQGHSKECKHFLPLRGRFVVAWVAIGDSRAPPESLVAEWAIISADKPEVISVPMGYANGLKALAPDSELMVFSNLTLQESISEKVVFPKDQWLDWDQFATQ